MPNEQTQDTLVNAEQLAAQSAVQEQEEAIRARLAQERQEVRMRQAQEEAGRVLVLASDGTVMTPEQAKNGDVRSYDHGSRS